MNPKSPLDIKQIMQEKIQLKEVKVNSPYAKYNSRGQLSCILCGTSVKSAIVWQAHINKKSHKHSILRMLVKQQQVNAVPSTVIKYQSTDIWNMRQGSIKKDKPKGILKKTIADYSSSDDSDDAAMQEISVQKNEPDSKLPHDFSDEKKTDVMNLNGAQRKEEVSALPEGFFDDPVADAKARKVEYKDKVEEEWQEYLREVSAAEAESRQIIAEDKQESAIEIQLEQATDQIKCLERIVEIDRVKKAKLEDVQKEDIKVEMEDSSDEEFSPFIWRTKNSLI